VDARVSNALGAQFVYDTDAVLPSANATFLHCAKCLTEFTARVPESKGQSPKTYARLNVGVTADGKAFQIWCVRHECNVALIRVHQAAEEIKETPVLSTPEYDPSTGA